MGNQQSNVRGGLQLCTVGTDQLAMCTTETDPQVKRFMDTKDFRVDFVSKWGRDYEQETIPKFEYRDYGEDKSTPGNRGNQQPKRSTEWQQKQEWVESGSEEVEKVRMEKGEVFPNQAFMNEEPKRNDVEGTVFKGVFGKITLDNTHVGYQDSTGNKYKEVFLPKELRKTFPMGISFGGLTKSLWFKDIKDRDVCFDMMSSIPPPSYEDVVKDPSQYSITTNTKKCELCDEATQVKIFEGINGFDVFVYADSRVTYTDMDGDEHCVNFNSDEIMRCIPYGICLREGTRNILFKDTNECDQCWAYMQMIGKGDKEKEEQMVRMFPGLYGNVVVKPCNGVEYTSLAGDLVTVELYNPLMLRRVFPLGITGGGLPSTIWFEEIEHLEDCIMAMQ